MTGCIDLNIFREYDIRGVVGEQLTETSVGLLGKAFGSFFSRNEAQRIAVGHDARESSPTFLEIICDGLQASGLDVVSIGMVPTPVLYHTMFTKDFEGGIMVTGSHNPADHNGFKICLGQRTLFGEQIQEIKALALSGDFTQGSGARGHLDVLDGYVTDLTTRSRMGPKRLTVVFDAGNGVGGLTAIPVFERLGMELIPLFADPDPSFPNHHPDPTVAENLADLQAAVAQHNADLGVAFDGDGDRIGVVDESGRVIWGDELMVLFSRSLLEVNPGASIIAEVKCSQTLFNEISAAGGAPIMWKVGHSLIKAKMRETGALLAGEMSGHFFFADRYYGFDDATYAGVRLFEILSHADKKLSDLLPDRTRIYSTPELRIDCPDELKFTVVERVADYFSRTNEVITIDGARVNFPQGWGLVRASNTQAMLVLRFEADSEESLHSIRSNVESAARRYML